MQRGDAVGGRSHHQLRAKAETGGPEDAEYLGKKVALGGHFAVIKGMSDVEKAHSVMQNFDGSFASLMAGISQSIELYEEAIDPSSGEFLMHLVGVSEDIFAF